VEITHTARIYKGQRVSNHERHETHETEESEQTAGSPASSLPSFVSFVFFVVPESQHCKGIQRLLDMRFFKRGGDLYAEAGLAFGDDGEAEANDQDAQFQ